MGRAAPAAARLADVVRRARQLPAQSVVRQPARAFTSQHTGGDAAPRAQPVPGRAAQLRSREIIRLSFHERGGTASDAGVVEARRTRRVYSGRVAREFRAPVIHQAQPPRGPLWGGGVASPATGV